MFKMINQSNFFDLYDVFVNELVGDVWLSIILGLIVIWYLTIRLRMPYQLTVLFGLLYLAIFFAETKIILIWVFIVLFIGTMFYYGVSKTMRKGYKWC